MRRSMVITRWTLRTGPPSAEIRHCCDRYGQSSRAQVSDSGIRSFLPSMAGWAFWAANDDTDIGANISLAAGKRCEICVAADGSAALGPATTMAATTAAENIADRATMLLLLNIDPLLDSSTECSLAVMRRYRSHLSALLRASRKMVSCRRPYFAGARGEATMRRGTARLFRRVTRNETIFRALRLARPAAAPLADSALAAVGGEHVAGTAHRADDR